MITAVTRNDARTRNDTTTQHDATTHDDATRPAPPQDAPTRPRRRMRYAAGGLAVAVLLLVLGAVMTSNANFSESYVTRQLAQQKITFKTVDALTPEERRSDCVVKNAGKLLTTGKQAECYANEFIGLHIKTLGKGRTYAELGNAHTALRDRVAAAQASGDPALPGLQKELADLSAQRELVFKAETLRGILLTSFGFSELGAKGAEAATASYLGAGVIGLLSVAGIVHALATRGRPTRGPGTRRARSGR